MVIPGNTKETIMTVEVDSKIVKLEPEEESKVNSFIATQRCLYVNNHIKEEICYESNDTNLVNYNINFVNDPNKDNNSNNCVNYIKVEHSYSCNNANLKSGFEEQNEDNYLSVNHKIKNDIKEEFNYKSNNTNDEYTFENLVGGQELDNNSSCGNQSYIRGEQSINRNSKLTVTTAILRDKVNSHKLTDQEYELVLYKCDHCDFETKWKHSFTAHRNKHQDVTYKCDQCEVVTKLRYNFKVHSIKHQDSRYKCNQCDFETMWKNSFKGHCVKHQDSIYKCNECHYITMWEKDLKKHFVKHKGVTFECDQCDFATKWRHNLKIHCGKHLGVTYKCEQCSFATKWRSFKAHCAKH